jgi:uncharacterized protein
MRLVLSPAKALDYTSPLPSLEGFTHSKPAYLEQAQTVMKRLRAHTPDELACLMGISDTLAALNTARHAEWSGNPEDAKARCAVFAFNGDVYEGLNARQLPMDAIAWLQAHLRILSGLYGVLRPLDRIEAYRLEMGTRLSILEAKDLYAFWGETIRKALDTWLETDPEGGVLIHLASQEYFKAATPAKLKHHRIIQPVFEDWKAGRYRLVSFYAKRARGLMTRYAAVHGLERAEDLKQFNEEGYVFVPDASVAERWVFRRHHP